MATVKQKLAFRKVLKGMPISHAMKAVNYAKTTSGNTTKLTASKGWHELIDKYISDEALMKVHREGLKATYVRKEYDEENKKAEIIKEPDYAVRHKYLETGYKIKGRLKNEGEGNTFNQLNIFWQGKGRDNPIQSS